MTFSVNDSPLAGTEGDKVTSRMIRDRLMREIEGNVAIRVKETEEKDSFEVAGLQEVHHHIDGFVFAEEIQHAHHRGVGDPPTNGLLQRSS